MLAASRESGSFDEDTLSKVEAFLNDPRGWSKAHGGVWRNSALLYSILLNSTPGEGAMSIDFQNFTPYASLIGGVMIGLAALLLMLAHGRVMGVSGILAALSCHRASLTSDGGFCS